MKLMLAVTAFLLCTATASGAPPKPFTLQCPNQDKSELKKPGIDFIWDGKQFTAEPKVGKTTVWPIDRSDLKLLGDKNYPYARQHYFNAAPTAEDVKTNRRDFLKLHILGDINLGLVSLFYTKARLLDGMVDYASTEYYAGCVNPHAAEKYRQKPLGPKPKGPQIMTMRME